MNNKVNNMDRLLSRSKPRKPATAQLSCTVPIETHERFIAFCKKGEVTHGAVLAQMVDDVVEEVGMYFDFPKLDSQS